jgi:hypothetical protein
MVGDEEEPALNAALEAIERKFGHGSIARLKPRFPSPLDLAIAEIMHIAKIPPEKRRPFANVIWSLIIGAWQSSEFRLTALGRKNDALVRKAEAGIRTACDAMRGLRPDQRDALERAFDVAGNYAMILPCEGEAPNGLMFELLEVMVVALASMTGKSPTLVGSTGGRRKKTYKDWQFRKLVGMLWKTVAEYGGELTFSCNANKGSGTMVDVLNVLRPLLPRLIPPALDQKAKTIDRIKRTLKNENYEPFGFVSSAMHAWPPPFI